MECLSPSAPIEHGALTNGCADDRDIAAVILDHHRKAVNDHFGAKLSGHWASSAGCLNTSSASPAKRGGEGDGSPMSINVHNQLPSGPTVPPLSDAGPEKLELKSGRAPSHRSTATP
jgi:hypothetical protein